MNYNQYLSLLDLAFLKTMLDQGMKAQALAEELLSYIHQYSSSNQQSLKTSLQFLIAEGANVTMELEEAIRSYSLSGLKINKDLLLTKDSANLFLRAILQADIITYKIHTSIDGVTTHHQDADLKKIEIQGELIKEALDIGAKLHEEDIGNIYISDLDGLLYHKELLLEHSTNSISGEYLTRICLDSVGSSALEYRYASDNSKLLQYNKKTHQANEIIEYAITKGIDMNYKDPSEEMRSTLYEDLFILNNFALLHLAEEANPTIHYTLRTEAWVKAITSNPNIGFIIRALQKSPKGFAKEEASELLSSYGRSNVEIAFIFDIYDLAKDVIQVASDPQSAALSSIELQILNIENNTLLSDYTKGDYINNYGFGPLSLALLGGNFELASKMISNNEGIAEKSHHGITPLQIINSLHCSLNFHSDAIALQEIILEKLNNIDIILNENGDSLIDIFIRSPLVADKALSKSNQSLFTFYKPQADLLYPSLHHEKIHIAITMGEGFWSTGINAVSRLISQKHPEVSFYLVTLEMMNAGGDKFIKQFNGWINPGAADSFPKNQAEFNKKDWAQSIKLEQAYQKVLNKTEEFKIPYIGICAGAQNLGLYHDGYLQPLKGYSTGKHTINFEPGTLSHFMAMTKEQQKYALNNCEFPKIAFKGDTAHHYAAVADKLGTGLELGAVSEDSIVMALAHKNGLRYATQFHPEHYYHIQHGTNEEVNHQKAWLENFIYLTELHHNHTTLGAIHPEMIFEGISKRLDECTENPTCLAVSPALHSNSLYFDI